MKSFDDFKKQVKLIKAIFDSPEGRELLDLLANQSHNQYLYTDNVNELYARVGRYDLVQELKNCLEMTEKDLKELSKSQEYSDNDW